MLLLDSSLPIFGEIEHATMPYSLDLTYTSPSPLLYLFTTSFRFLMYNTYVQNAAVQPFTATNNKECEIMHCSLPPEVHLQYLQYKKSSTNPLWKISSSFLPSPQCIMCVSCIFFIPDFHSATTILLFFADVLLKDGHLPLPLLCPSSLQAVQYSLPLLHSLALWSFELHLKHFSSIRSLLSQSLTTCS